MSRIYINDGWLFAPQFKDGYLNGEVDEAMTHVRLPHTVKELPYNYFSEEEYQTLSTYVRVINAPNEWKGKRIILTFEGAAHFAEVFLNGQRIGDHRSGYTAFSIELTEHLNIGGSNILTVRLDSRETLNQPPFGNVIDYMTYGGIYRDVYLDIKESVYISDVFVKPEITGKIASDVTLSGTIPEGLIIQQTATFEDDETLVVKKGVYSNTVSLHGFVKNVKLWTLTSPRLYEVVTEIYLDERLVDSHRVRVGFRSAQFKEDGFYLNGRKTRIRGLNRHQSYPYVGYAMPQSMQELDADILKHELGLNAVRTSHYPQSQYFIDRCDEIGLLVFTEIPGWQHIGVGEWRVQAVKNVEEMILQYRNHPSIILWGVRVNESQDDNELYTRTNELAHRLDPTRQTGGVRCIKKSSLLEDVYTYNDFVYDGKGIGCNPKEKITPDASKPYLVTENNGHMFPTKSFDSEEHRLEHALRHAKVLDSIASHDDISGSFAWCMFDYNTHKDFGSGDRICYHGVLDMFRNHKLASAVYASQEDGDTVLEVSSSMDIGEHPASVKGEVWVFTNADSVRMYKNDVLIKEYPSHNEHFPNLEHSPILIDDYVGDLLEKNEGFSQKKATAVAEVLNYMALHGYSHPTPELKAMFSRCVMLHGMNEKKITELYGKYIGDWGGASTVYRFEAIRGGKVARTVVKQTMSSMTLEAIPSSTVLSERTSYDVAEVRLRAIDENGNLLPFCGEPIMISVDGPLQIVGPDITSLRGGMGGFYVKTVGTKGRAMVTVFSPAFESVRLEFRIK